MSSFLIQAKKLQNIENHLENVQETFIKSLQDANLSLIFNKNLNDRNEELEQLRKTILNVLEPFDNIKEKILNNSTDLSVLKTDIIVLKENIYNVQKELNRKLRELQREEAILYESIHIMEETMMEYEKPIRKSIKNDVYVKSATQSLPKQSNYVLKTMKKRWKDADHNIFIKYKQKCNDVEKLAVKIHAIFPDKSIEEIKSYNEWYQKCILEREKQKEVIKEWKKTNEKVNKPKSAKILENFSPQSKKEQQNEDINKKLAEWKKMKEEKWRSEKNSELMLLRKQKERAQLEKLKNDEKKIFVNEWKRNKYEKELNDDIIKKEIEQNDKLQKSKIASQLIKHYQQADLKYIENMRKRVKKYDEEVKVEELLQNKCCASVDITRLIRPTKQWTSRISKTDKQEQSGHGMFEQVSLPFKMGIPEWRKNMHRIN